MRAHFLATAAAALAVVQGAQLAIDATNVTNPEVNRRWMGCHADPGYTQIPRGLTVRGMVHQRHRTGRTLAFAPQPHSTRPSSRRRSCCTVRPSSKAP